jgi:hypothetical protein
MPDLETIRERHRGVHHEGVLVCSCDLGATCDAARLAAMLTEERFETAIEAGTHIALCHRAKHRDRWTGECRQVKGAARFILAALEAEPANHISPDSRAVEQDGASVLSRAGDPVGASQGQAGGSADDPAVPGWSVGPLAAEPPKEPTL